MLTCFDMKPLGRGRGGPQLPWRDSHPRESGRDTMSLSQLSTEPVDVGSPTIFVFCLFVCFSIFLAAIHYIEYLAPQFLLYSQVCAAFSTA
jgi:hypothetical protein